MRKILFNLCLCAILTLIVGVSSAFADSYSLKLISGGNYSLYGTYVGMYTVSVNGKNESLLCDDYSTHISAGDDWTAFTYANVTSMKFGTNTTFGYSSDGTTYTTSSMNAAQAYAEVFWITDKITKMTDSKAIGAASFAIWYIMNSATPAAAATSGETGIYSSAYWINQAQSGYSSIDTSKFIVYTPYPTNSSQEFVGIVPEPTTLLLLGFGLIGLARLGIKFQK